MSYRDAIARIESGGNYGALGPFTKGDRPYGKYQVMGNNVGPWTRRALGRELSRSEFLASPAAQDATFDTIFGGYVNKYGPEGAAQAWFGGPGSVGKSGRKDVLGTSVGSYGRQFMGGLGADYAGAPVPQTGNVPPTPAAELGNPLTSFMFGDRNPASGQVDIPQFQEPPLTPESFFMGLAQGRNPLKQMVFSRIASLFA